MAENYFAKFPIITYSNNAVVNIIERAKLDDNTYNNPYIYYKYDVKDGQRPDQIANFYYNDQFMDWIVYFSNKTVDPYYDWYMSEDVFKAFLVKKYNLLSVYQVSLLENKIYNYTNNWYSESKISVSDYNSLLTEQHRYWIPYYGKNDEIIGYTRRVADWTLNTNQIVSYTINSASNFIKNEVVSINFSANSVGKAQILTSNSTSVVVQHTSGHIFDTPSGSSYIYGTESGSNVVFSAVTSIANNINAGEESYWDPVSIYDYERTKNEANKSIKLLNRTYSTQLSTALSKIL